jgi:hypothetical protein
MRFASFQLLPRVGTSPTSLTDLNPLVNAGITVVNPPIVSTLCNAQTITTAPGLAAPGRESKGNDMTWRRCTRGTGTAPASTRSFVTQWEGQRYNCERPHGDGTFSNLQTFLGIDGVEGEEDSLKLQQRSASKTPEPLPFDRALEAKKAIDFSKLRR